MKNDNYDPACAELAKHFIGNEATAVRVNDLAFTIQCAIEDWLNTEQLSK